MNLNKLFQAQKELDEKIIKEKGLKDMDRLPYLILALQVELGELANEWRGFKFWSNNREPRTEVKTMCKTCVGLGTPVGIPEESGVDCWNCNGTGIIDSNPLLEEFVDCLHFILSIGFTEYTTSHNAKLPVRMGFFPEEQKPIKYDTIIEQFNCLFHQIGYLYDCVTHQEFGSDTEVDDQYSQSFRMILGLGEMLGFTSEQIEESYFEKNLKNHERQATNY